MAIDVTVANRCHYADNDPVNKVDPSGMRPSDCGLAPASGATELSCDRAGDGKYVEVFGDLRTAHDVAVVVPGTGAALGNGNHTVLRENARNLYQASRGSVAVVAWLGYDTPDGLDDGRVASADLAREGAPDLARFVGGLRGKTVSVVAHSYGTLVGAEAILREGMHPANFVIVGSPGVLKEHASDFAPSRVWVGLADGDQIGDAGNYGGVAGGLIGCATFGPVGCIVGGGIGVHAGDRVHGPDPARPEFGATRFTTTGANGHSQYFNPGTQSLNNMALVIQGYYCRVELVDGMPCT